jgi:hypothetical protein
MVATTCATLRVTSFQDRPEDGLDERLGNAIRMVRVRSRRRESDVALDPGVRRSVLIAMERGSIDGNAEGVEEAFRLPGRVALVAFGSPSGRSSAAQGIVGAVGTIGSIVATFTWGVLWPLRRSWPLGVGVGAGRHRVLRPIPG